MTNEDLWESLNKVFRYPDAQTQVDGLLRQYLLDVLKAECPDTYGKWVTLAMSFSYPLKFVVEQPPMAKENIVRKYSDWGIALFAILGCAVGNATCSKPVLGSMAGFAVGKAAVELIDRFVYDGQEAVHSNADIKLKTTADEIVEFAVRLSEKLIALTRLDMESKTDTPTTQSMTGTPANKSLDADYYDILKWMHSLFEATADETILDDVKRIASRHGYEFVEYSQEKSDCFNQSQGNVSAPETSLPALVNSRTGDCLFKGHVIMPM